MPFSTRILGCLGLVGLTLATIACNERANMGGENSKRREPYRGPIPVGFGNASDAAAFGAAASTEAFRLDRALTAFRLQDSVQQGLSLRAEAPSDLPQLARCASITAMTGGLLDAGNAAALTDSVPFIAIMDGMSCDAALGRVGVSFPSVAAALQQQLLGLSSFGLGADECTTTKIDEEKGATHAVRYELERQPAASGVYLSSFDLPLFSAELEGASNGAQLALRSEVEMRARATDKKLYQWGGLATLIDPGTASLKSHRGDYWEAGELRISRQSEVAMTYGDVTRLDEITKTTIERGAGPARVIDAHVSAVTDENSVKVLMQRFEAGSTSSTKLRLVVVEGVAGQSCVVEAW